MDTLQRLCIRLHARVFRIHLEESPRIAVYHRDMSRTIVKRERMPVQRILYAFLLRRSEERLKEISVIMVALYIPDRRLLQHLRNLGEPVLQILLALIARAKRNIATMKDHIRLHMADHLRESLLRMEKMRIRHRDHAHMIRILGQCMELSRENGLITDQDLILVLRIWLQSLKMCRINEEPCLAITGWRFLPGIRLHTCRLPALLRRIAEALRCQLSIALHGHFPRNRHLILCRRQKVWTSKNLLFLAHYKSSETHQRDQYLHQQHERAPPSRKQHSREALQTTRNYHPSTASALLCVVLLVLIMSLSPDGRDNKDRHDSNRTDPERHDRIKVV